MSTRPIILLDDSDDDEKTAEAVQGEGGRAPSARLLVATAEFAVRADDAALLTRFGVDRWASDETMDLALTAYFARPNTPRHTFWLSALSTAQLQADVAHNRLERLAELRLRPFERGVQGVAAIRTHCERLLLPWNLQQRHWTLAVLDLPSAACSSTTRRRRVWCRPPCRRRSRRWWLRSAPIQRSRRGR